DHPEVIAVRHDEFIDVRKEKNGVRLAKTRDAMKSFALQIKNLNGLVVLRCQENSLVLQVYCQMVEITRKIWQRRSGHQFEQLLFLSPSHRRESKKQRQADTQRSFHFWSPWKFHSINWHAQRVAL